MRNGLRGRGAACVSAIVMVLVLGAIAPLAMAGDASSKTGRFNLHRDGAGTEAPGSWLQLKLCLMPESKLKFIEAGETLRPFMKRAFRDGKMHPDQFIDQVARLTGYKAEDIRRGEGYACYAYFTYLPAIAEYLATEGAVDPASDTGDAPAGGGNGLNTAPLSDIPAVLRFVENAAASSLRDAAVPGTNAPAR
jgi:hypothetical protein